MSFNGSPSNGSLWREVPTVAPTPNTTQASITEKYQGEVILKKINLRGQSIGLNSRGVAVSADNEIFVTDIMNKRIQVFRIDGAFLRLFPTVVPGNQTAGPCQKETDHEMEPYDVTIDMVGNLWVVGFVEVYSGVCAYVVYYNCDGQPITQLKTGWGLIPGPDSTVGIAVDVLNHRIVLPVWNKMLVFTSDVDGSFDKGEQFGDQPIYRHGYVTADNEGNIYISDQSDDDIHVYYSNGTEFFEFGYVARAKGERIIRPSGICKSTRGHIIVANTGSERVDMFTRHGVFVRTVVNMSRPTGIAMGPDGQLVVTEENSVTIVPRQMVYP